MAVEERVYQGIDDDTVFVGVPDDVVVKQAVSTVRTVTGSDVAVAAPPAKPIAVAVPMPITLTEGYLEIRKVGTEEEVTAIEVLSPTNKRPGEGRQQYEKKRQIVLGSDTHLIEIDLLRQWNPMLVFSQGVESQYRVLVSRSHTRPRADLYAFNLQDPIPVFPVPLLQGDSEPTLDLYALLQDLYDLGSYDLRIDYCQPPVPPLAEADVTWTDRLLANKGLRETLS